MRRMALTILAGLLLAPAAARAGDGDRDAAEASLFRGYYLESVKRDLKAAAEAYTEAAWSGEQFPEIGVRAYLGLARTYAALENAEAPQMFETAAKYLDRVAKDLPPKTATALKEEVEETARLLRGGERRADLDDEIVFQLERMKNAWGVPAGAEAKAKLALYGERAVPIVAPALRGRDPRLVRNAAEVLAEIGGPAAAEALAAAATDPDVLFPVRLAEGVAGSDRPELDGVKTILLASDLEEVRWTITDAARPGELGLPAIARMLLDDSDRVRERGVFLFERLDGTSLGESDRPLLEDLLAHGDPRVRLEALTRASELGGRTAADAVARALPDREPEIAAKALRLLSEGRVPFEARFAPGVVDAAVGYLRADVSAKWKEDVAGQAVGVLAGAGFPGGDTALLPLLRALDRHPDALRAVLARLDPGRVSPELARAALADLSGEPRRWWFERFDSRLTPEALLEAAAEIREGGDPAFRYAAAMALFGRLPPERWPELGPWIEDATSRVRELAAQALARKEGTGSRLLECLDEEPELAEPVARQVLAQSGEEGARALLGLLRERNPVGFERAFLVAYRAATDEQVLAALRSRDFATVSAGATAARERNLRDAWPLLLERSSGNPAAKQALESIRAYVLGLKEYRDLEESLEADAFEKARRLAGSGDAGVREAAALALAALGDRKAIGVLLDLVTDDDAAVRAAAKRALERLAGGARTPDGGSE